MKDDLKTPSAPASRIDIAEDGQPREWAKKLDATPEQIREAVSAVGDLAADVEMHLKGTHATTNADTQARAEALSNPRQTS